MKNFKDNKPTLQSTNNFPLITTKAEFESFYSFYLSQHQNISCRRLHFVGSSFGLIGLATTINTGKISPLLKGITAGYACAWVGHFFFEINKPATFKYPVQIFSSDFRMYADVLRGRLSLKDPKFDKVS